MSRYVAKNMKSLQIDWNKVTQNRIVATSSMLSCMKFVKMLGLQTFLARKIQELRTEELHVASKVRWINVYYNSSGKSSDIAVEALIPI
jgi:ATP-binding cassette subfamily C (CFTR/MRP) protein 1